MPLLKRTVTAARLAANRRAALKSTGPRTALGKSRSSRNAFRHGSRSRTMRLFYQILLQAPPGYEFTLMRELLTPAQLSNPYVAYMANVFRCPGDTPIEPDHSLDWFFRKKEARRGNFLTVEA